MQSRLRTRRLTPGRTAGFLKVGAGLLLALAGSIVLIGDVGAATSPTPSTFVPITPCRLVDTRSTDQVGGRGTPLGAAETVTFQVWGSNGNCTIPATAVGIATNTTAVNPTGASFLTVWPADAGKPLSSNLNWVPSSPPTPNQVTVGLSASGAISAYNHAGSIDVIIDIVGYYIALPAPVAPVAPVPQKAPTAYASTRNTQVALNTTGGLGGSVTVNPMFLPPGTYLVTFTTTIVNFSTSTDYFRCGIFKTGNAVTANAVLLGPSVGPVVPMTVQTVVSVTSAGPSSVGSFCLHDATISTTAGTLYLDPGATTTAIPVDFAGAAAT